MFNEMTLKDMETIDILVSEANKKIFDSKSKLFLTWTFPTNHRHKDNIICSYFTVWVGETGKGKLKSICFGSINRIPKLLDGLSKEELQKILDSKYT